MRVFTVPARYADELEAGIARLVHEVQLDAWRRDNRHKPILDDAFIEKDRKGDVFVVIGEFHDRLPLAVEIARGKVVRPRQRKRA